jgi:hypothetical protein
MGPGGGFIRTNLVSVAGLGGDSEGGPRRRRLSITVTVTVTSETGTLKLRNIRNIVT